MGRRKYGAKPNSYNNNNNNNNNVLWLTEFRTKSPLALLMHTYLSKERYR